jgi:hypothetical protein
MAGALIAAASSNAGLWVEQPMNDIFVMNDKLALGMNSAGNWGTKDSRLLTNSFRGQLFHTNPDDSLGMVVNVSDKGDYFLPGSQFEAYSFGSVGGPHYCSSRDGSRTATAKPTGLNYTVDDAGATITFTATGGDLALEMQAFIGADDADTVPVDITLKNTGIVPINAYYTRKADPEQVVQSTWSGRKHRATQNTVVANDLQTGSIVKSEGKVGGSVFTLASFEPGASVDHGRDEAKLKPWRYEGPSKVPTGMTKYWEKPISLAMEFGVLAPGEQKTKKYYMIMTTNLTEAEVKAVEMDEDKISVHGDPLFKHKGKAAHFWIPTGTLTPLLEWKSKTGAPMRLFGKTFGKPVDKKNSHQWFNQFVVSQDNTTIIDVAANPFSNNASVKGNSMLVMLDGKPLHHSQQKGVIKRYASAVKKSVKLSIMKRPTRLKIGDKSAEKLHVAAGGLEMSIFSSKAAKFASKKQQVKFMHLNIAFDAGIPKDATGIFAELAGVEPISPSTTELLKKPTKPAANALLPESASPTAESASA